MTVRGKRRERVVDQHTTINYPEAPKWAYLCQWSVTLPAIAFVPLVVWVCMDRESLSRTLIAAFEFRWATSTWFYVSICLLCLLYSMHRYYHYVIAEKDSHILDLKNFILTLQNTDEEKDGE